MRVLSPGPAMIDGWLVISEDTHGQDTRAHRRPTVQDKEDLWIPQLTHGGTDTLSGGRPG